MMRRFLGALQFLTTIPIRTSTLPPGRCVAFFPLVGALIGLSGAAVLRLSMRYLPSAIASILVLTFWSWLTGLLHEDGLADTADAFRVGRSADTIHRILKDSRIGVYGASALVLSFSLRWQALENMSLDPYRALAAAQGMARAGVVALAWITRPAGTGSGAELSHSMSSLSAMLAILQGVALAALCGFPTAVWAVSGSAIIVWCARFYFEARIGGFTGDCLGAVEQLIEIFILVLSTWRTSS